MGVQTHLSKEYFQKTRDMQKFLFLAVGISVLHIGFGMSIELSRAHRLLYGSPDDHYANWFLSKQNYFIMTRALRVRDEIRALN